MTIRYPPWDLKARLRICDDEGWGVSTDDGPEITEDCEQCTDCLRYGYDPHQDVCLLCGHGQLRPDSDDDDYGDGT